jgi:hypothetical protein
VANAVGQSNHDDQPDRVRQQAGSYRFAALVSMSDRALSSDPPSIGTYHLATRINLGHRLRGAPL